jgi:hypothetical protein
MRPIARPLLFTLACISFAFAQEATEPATSGAEDDAVARLEVVSTGEQTLDVLTGETVLVDGGVIIDRKTGLELNAPSIRYVQGDFIQAENASARMAGGMFTAATMRVDVDALTAEAGGSVRFEREGLRLTAPLARIDFEREFATFETATGENPMLEAERLVLNLNGGAAVLFGPYVFQNGPFTLSDDRSDSALQIDPVEREDGSVSYRAANEVDDALWEQIKPYREP